MYPDTKRYYVCWIDEDGTRGRTNSLPYSAAIAYIEAQRWGGVKSEMWIEDENGERVE